MLVSVCATAQPETRPTTGDQAAEWLKRRIEANYAQRTGQSNALANHRFHFVFLFNCSLAGAKSAYTEFAKTTVRSFLDDRVRSTADSGPPDRLSFYPYQLDLYGPPYSVESLTLDRAAIEAFERVFPTAPFSVRGDGRTPMPAVNGHDNMTPRRQLMDRLGAPDQDLPILIVQFTDTSVNEDPGDRPHDQAIRPVSGQFGLLEGSGFVAYDVTGQPFKAESVHRSFDVHTWLYGPSTFRNATVVTAGARAALDGSGPPAWLLPAGLLVLVLGAITFLIWRYWTHIAAGKTRAVRIAINDKPTTVSFGECVTVVGSGAPPPSKPGPTVPFTDAGAPATEMFRIDAFPGAVSIKVLLGQLDEAGGTPINRLHPGTYDMLYKYERYVKRFKLVVEMVDQQA